MSGRSAVRRPAGLILIAALAAAACDGAAKAGKGAGAPYKDPSLSIERRTADLLSRMTPEEMTLR